MIRASSGVMTLDVHPRIEAARDASPISESYVGWPQVALIEPDVLLPVESDMAEGKPQEISDGVSGAGPEYIVTRLSMLQHRPHTRYIFGRITPVPDSIRDSQGSSASRLPAAISATARVISLVTNVKPRRGLS